MIPWLSKPAGNAVLASSALILTSSSVSSSGSPSKPLSSSSSPPIFSSPFTAEGSVCGFSRRVYARVEAPKETVESMGICWGLWASKRMWPKKVPCAEDIKMQNSLLSLGSWHSSSRISEIVTIVSRYKALRKASYCWKHQPCTPTISQTETTHTRSAQKSPEINYTWK